MLSHLKRGETDQTPIIKLKCVRSGLPFDRVVGRHGPPFRSAAAKGSASRGGAGLRLIYGGGDKKKKKREKRTKESNHPSTKIIRKKLQWKEQLPLFTRVPEEEKPGLKIGDRDLMILQAVMKYRFITSTQLKALLWSIPERSLQSRLKKLYHNEFLNRPREQRVLRITEGLNEIIYSLGDRGVDLLATHLV